MSKNMPIMALEPTLNNAVVGPPMLSTWGQSINKYRHQQWNNN
jgi:hypothetical protein